MVHYMNNNLKKIYSEINGSYETVNHAITLGLDILWRKKAVKAALSFKPLKCLDICTGTGETAIYLKERLPKGATVTATDFSKEMIAVATAKKESAGIVFHVDNAYELPFKDAEFDVVTISFATRNLNTSHDALVKAFKEIHRVLRPDGHFINLETSQPRSALIRALFHAYVKLVVYSLNAGYKYLASSMRSFYTAEELSMILKEAGFTKVTYTPLMFGAAAIHVVEK